MEATVYELKQDGAPDKDKKPITVVTYKNLILIPWNRDSGPKALTSQAYSHLSAKRITPEDYNVEDTVYMPSINDSLNMPQEDFTPDHLVVSSVEHMSLQDALQAKDKYLSELSRTDRKKAHIGDRYDELRQALDLAESAEKGGVPVRSSTEILRNLGTPKTS